MTLIKKNMFKISPETLSEQSIFLMRGVATFAMISIVITALVGLWLAQHSVTIESAAYKTALGWSTLTHLINVIIYCFALFYILNNPFIRVLGGKQTVTDEWEKALKLRAEAFSYRSILYILIAMIAVTFLGSVINPTSSSVRLMDVTMQIVFLFLFFTLLPFAYVAWTIKPIGED